MLFCCIKYMGDYMTKRQLLLFVVILLVIAWAPITEAKLRGLPLLNKLICIDAGHGGRDPGAVSGKLLEKDFNLSISKITAKQLNEAGASTYLIRTSDIDFSDPNLVRQKKSDLDERIRKIDASGCDLYLSIHLNAAPNTSWSKAQVLYHDSKKSNKILAERIQYHFKKYLKSPRTIVKIGDLYMYKNIKTTGVLLEVGFITNPGDRYLLKKTEYQSKIGIAIREGLISYFDRGGM